MISKRFQQKGTTSNHGMSEVDFTKRKLLEDKLLNETQEITTGCGNGCTFHFLNEEVSLREALLLEDHIRDNNLCPFCRKINGKEDFKFCAENQNKILEVDFEMNGTIYKTMYKPHGYK